MIEHSPTARLKLGWADTAAYQSILGAGIISCGVGRLPFSSVLGPGGVTVSNSIALTPPGLSPGDVRSADPPAWAAR